MLAKAVVREFGDQARYADEDFGASKLAERFGVTQYPAVFVDDALVARPQDFWTWSPTEPGRYHPWKDEGSHKKFADDLRRAIAARLRGEELESARIDPAARLETATLPDFVVPDLAGAELRTADLAGKVVVVEVWAPWCPPSLSTLQWLDGLEGRFGDRLVVVALGTAAPAEEIRKTAEARKMKARVAIADDALLGRFGPVFSVPALFLFGPDGKTEAVFYGASDDLHEKVEAALTRLLEPAD